VVADFIQTRRPNVTDDHDREPLVATEYGRASRTTITKHVYLSTSPCFYNGGTCPFNEDPQECQSTEWGHASKCPGSVSPHALRRGYVTAARNAGQPKDVTGERVNMSGKILEKHYDKAERREEVFAVTHAASTSGRDALAELRKRISDRPLHDAIGEDVLVNAELSGD
jgi:hypothetical protein